MALKTIEKVSEFKLLFQYLPEYIEIVLNAYNALKNYFHPTTPLDCIEGMVRNGFEKTCLCFRENNTVVYQSSHLFIHLMKSFEIYYQILYFLPRNTGFLNRAFNFCDLYFRL